MTEFADGAVAPETRYMDDDFYERSSVDAPLINQKDVESAELQTSGSSTGGFFRGVFDVVVSVGFIFPVELAFSLITAC